MLGTCRKTSDLWSSIAFLEGFGR